MLVLTRAVDEHIIIAGDIRITILAIGSRGQVKVGIDAPPEISVVRAELLTRKTDAAGMATIPAGQVTEGISPARVHADPLPPLCKTPFPSKRGKEREMR